MDRIFKGRILSFQRKLKNVFLTFLTYFCLKNIEKERKAVLKFALRITKTQVLLTLRLITIFSSSRNLLISDLTKTNT